MKILLIEDNLDQQLLIRRACEQALPEYAIEAAKEGVAALDYLENNRVDAVVLDYSLPTMTGLEVLGQIHLKYPGTPVIMVTGQGAESIAVEAMKLGAYDYIIKTGHYFENIPRVIQKAIEKSQLKEKLEKSSLRLRKLQEVSLSLTSERNLETLANMLVKGVSDLLECEGSILFLIDPQSAQINFTSSFGVDMAWAAFNSKIDTIGLLGTSYLNRKPFITDSPEKDPFWNETPEIKPMPKQLISVPLIQQGKIGGVLVGLNRNNGLGFTQEDLDALLTLTINAGVAFDNARFIQEKEKQAVTDSLTGLNNRLEFQKRFSIEYERSLRNQSPFSLLMIDIDHFKRINDTYGHPSGDSVIIETVNRIQGCIRNFDLMARYGGEEFVVILPESDGSQAKLVADRVLKAVNGGHFLLPHEVREHLSVSIGIASFPPLLLQKKWKKQNLQISGYCQSLLAPGIFHSIKR
ncbi:MAG: diguanylate cyclase [Nitrospirae bacterium]|nr:diguanylate cyclase [Nitrospirota bacterium]